MSLIHTKLSNRWGNFRDTMHNLVVVFRIRRWLSRRKMHRAQQLQKQVSLDELIQTAFEIQMNFDGLAADLNKKDPHDGTLKLPAGTVSSSSQSF